MIEHWAELHNNYCVHSNKAEDAKNELCVEIKQHLENFISAVRLFLDKTNIPYEDFNGCGVYSFDEGLFCSDVIEVDVGLTNNLVEVTFQKYTGFYGRVVSWRPSLKFQPEEIVGLFEKFPEWENKFLAMQDENKARHIEEKLDIIKKIEVKENELKTLKIDLERYSSI